MIASLSGDGSLPPDTLEQLTPELLTRMEPSVITAAIATRKTQVGYYKREWNHVSVAWVSDSPLFHPTDTYNIFILYYSVLLSACAYISTVKHSVLIS